MFWLVKSSKVTSHFFRAPSVLPLLKCLWTVTSQHRKMFVVIRNGVQHSQFSPASPGVLLLFAFLQSCLLLSSSAEKAATK